MDLLKTGTFFSKIERKKVSIQDPATLFLLFLPGPRGLGKPYFSVVPSPCTSGHEVSGVSCLPEFQGWCKLPPRGPLPLPGTVYILRVSWTPRHGPLPLIPPGIQRWHYPLFPRLLSGGPSRSICCGSGSWLGRCRALCLWRGCTLGFR